MAALASTTGDPCFPVPTLGLVGFSDSGKTTLLELAIPLLVATGLRVAVIKHAHHALKAVEGTDSARFVAAGATRVLVAGPGRAITDAAESLDDPVAVRAWMPLDLDLILVEGFKLAPWPKFWLGDTAPVDVQHAGPWVPLNPQISPADLADALRDWLNRERTAAPWRTGILIGGGSGRMGLPKSLLMIEGMSMLDRLLTGAIQAVLLGAGGTDQLVSPVPRLPDAPGVAGPMGGVLAAMRWDPRSAWFVTACDFPYLDLEARTWLIGQRAPGRWVIAPILDGEVIPVAAIYEPQCRPHLELAAARGERSLQRILAALPQTYAPEVPGHLRRAFSSANTPAEWRALTGEEPRIAHPR